MTAGRQSRDTWMTAPASAWSGHPPGGVTKLSSAAANHRPESGMDGALYSGEHHVEDSWGGVWRGPDRRRGCACAFVAGPGGGYDLRRGRDVPGARLRQVGGAI